MKVFQIFQNHQTQSAVMRILVFLTLSYLLVLSSIAQPDNYTSLSSGGWTTPANWNHTSGSGSSTPGISADHGSGTVNLNHSMSISSGYTLGSNTTNVNSGSTLIVNGNLTLGGGSAMNVSGDLTVTGDVTLNSILTINTGGSVTIQGNVVVNSNENLVVGASGASGSPFADLIILGNLSSISSGDAKFYGNSRVGIGGDVIDNGSGGTLLSVEDGGQVYVDGDISFTGGGNSITNNNSTDPYGLYVNGSVTNSGGGATTSSNLYDRSTMESTNVPFTNWINANLVALPIELISFEASPLTEDQFLFEWTTANELNNAYFTVEYSSDGARFTELASIDGAINSSSLVDYSLIEDLRSNSPSLYFRLKQTDIDGRYSYSEIITLSQQTELFVYPNPAQSTLNILTDFSSINVYNVTGLLIETFSKDQFTDQLTIDCSSYPQGIYTIEAISASERETIQVVISR